MEHNEILMVTLAAIVVIAAIVCFFAQEFGRLFKSILAIKWMNVILPLAFASYLVCDFQVFFMQVIGDIRTFLLDLLQYIEMIFPVNSYVISIIVILYLTALSILPVVLLDIYHRKRTFKPYPYPYLTSTLLWITCSLLMITV